MKKLIKYIPVIGIVIFLISTFNFLKIKINPSDIFSLAGMAIGLLGLIPAWWSAKITAKSAQESSSNSWQERLDIIGNRFDSRLSEVANKCVEIDERQNEQISLMFQRVAKVESLIDLKQVSYEELIKHLFDVQKRLASQEGYLAVSTRMGEFNMRLDRTESQVREVLLHR